MQSERRVSVGEHRGGGAGRRAEATQKEATRPRTTYYSQLPVGSGSPFPTEQLSGKLKMY